VAERGEQQPVVKLAVVERVAPWAVLVGRLVKLVLLVSWTAARMLNLTPLLMVATPAMSIVLCCRSCATGSITTAMDKSMRMIRKAVMTATRVSRVSVQWVYPTVSVHNSSAFRSISQTSRSVTTSTTTVMAMSTKAIPVAVTSAILGFRAYAASEPITV
jgi:hypothetical protein